MGRLSSFTFLSLDGYYKGTNDDISWHKHGAEESEYSAESLKANNILLFGRATYEMMAGFWPTPEAAKAFPEVAAGMNKAEKIVFSRMLKNVDWQNSRIVNDNLLVAIQVLKQQEKDMTILGSGSIVAQLAEAGLIDTYQVMIDPVAIGKGTPLFQNMACHLDLKLTETRTFNSGVVLLNYEST
ncbi:dihydrofolate reductase family protein [Flavisolibacter tropicus]|uniref:Dihydrofolate reductase n=1 Tax=Flavisolibacter tropicus TaxID=1492898 RepID=A0A172TV30_9BACT|nr:dihydrofolate reductase family protein [Flavisolibacter tropicus]ANE50744.1 dihydrofolate reductase [Flavisolibacter tropicus]